MLDLNTILTILMPSLIITIILVLLRVLAWKLGGAVVLSALARIILVGSTLIPTMLIYYLNKPDFDMSIALIPPLFYDLAYAYEILTFTQAFFGVLTFMFMLLIALLWTMLPSPCLVGAEMNMQQCISNLSKRPHWLWSIVIAYSTTLMLGLGIPHLHYHLYEINPILPFIPLALVVIVMLIIIRRSGRIISLPIPSQEPHQVAPAGAEG